MFGNESARWEVLQRHILAIIRVGFPAATVVLSGNDWSSVDGLLRLHPVADPNVVYTLHFYEPTILTTLAAFEPGLDRTALASLPFPVSGACGTGGSGRTLAVMQYYCSGNWNAAMVRSRLALAVDWGKRNHAAVIVGEFGATNQLNTAARLAWLTAVRRAAANQGLGWALWGYDDIMGLAVHRPPGERPALDPDVLHALGLRVPG